MKLLWITATVIAVVVGGYVFWQYRTSQPPSLAEIPATNAEVPVSDVPEPQRSAAEAQLRDLASTAQPGYRVVGEHFFAAKALLPWDALRHDVSPYLGSRGYELDRNGMSSDYQITYSLYRHDGTLRRWFNDDILLAAGLVKQTIGSATEGQVHLYGYFQLSPQ